VAPKSPQATSTVFSDSGAPIEILAFGIAALVAAG
jgi:hypothetical protein